MNAIRLQAASKVISAIKLWRLSHIGDKRAQPIKIIPFDHQLRAILIEQLFVCHLYHHAMVSLWHMEHIWQQHTKIVCLHAMCHCTTFIGPYKLTVLQVPSDPNLCTWYHI